MGFLSTVSACMVAMKLLHVTDASWLLVMLPFGIEILFKIRQKYKDLKRQRELYQALQDIVDTNKDKDE